MYPQPTVINIPSAPRRRRAAAKPKKRKRFAGAALRKALYAMPQGKDPRLGLVGADWKSADAMQRAVRRAAGFKGVGDYGWQGSLLRGIGETAGSWWGNRQGGRNLGAHVSKFFGFGDYGPTVTNSLIGGDGAPISVNKTSNSGDMVFEHTEFVKNISVVATGAGTSTFALEAFELNPGLPNVFPFLSQLAANFTMYEFAGLMFQYRPTSGEFGSTNSNALGKVIFATNYDGDADNFITSVQMENYDYASSCKPSTEMIHGVETAPTQRMTEQLYVRTGASPKDKILTDLGKFQVGTEGIYCGAAGTFVIGELWVTYKIKLTRAFLGTSSLGLDNDLSKSLWIGQSTGATNMFNNSQTFVNSLSNSAYYTPLASGVTNQMVGRKSNALPWTITSTGLANVTITIPANSTGTYMLQLITGLGAAAAGYYYPVPTFTNAATLYTTLAVGALGSAGSGIGSGTTGATGVTSTYTCFIAVAYSSTASTVTFTLSGNVDANAITSLIVTQYPTNFI